MENKKCFLEDFLKDNWLHENKIGKFFIAVFGLEFFIVKSTTQFRVHSKIYVSGKVGDVVEKRYEK